MGSHQLVWYALTHWVNAQSLRIGEGLSCVLKWCQCKDRHKWQVSDTDSQVADKPPPTLMYCSEDSVWLQYENKNETFVLALKSHRNRLQGI